ncbi:MAG: NAD-dependent epimerase/dehydratase family protein [Actinomycetota bacterium]
MEVLVTGAAGFIGSNLVDRLLADGHVVVGVDDLSTGKLENLSDARREGGDRFVFYRADICDEETRGLILRHRPEAICHLAAQIDVRASVADPIRDAQVNLIGLLNVAQSAVEAGTRRIVFACSGGTIYGEPDTMPVPETYPGRPLSPYGVSKRAGEDYLHVMAALHGLEYVSLALANVYGPRQDPFGEAGVVAIFASKMLEGQPAMVFGDGLQARDFIFVDDVADAFARALSRGAGRRFNVGTGQLTTVLELYREIAAATGYEREPVFAPERLGELRRISLDVARAAEGLEWRPWTDLASGIRATVAWFRERSRAGA